MQLMDFCQIRLALQKSFQLLPKSDHLQQGTAPLQIHQKIQITAGSILAAGHRAIDPEVAGSMAMSHGKDLLTGGLNPLGERAVLGRCFMHGPILNGILDADLTGHPSRTSTRLAAPGCSHDPRPSRHRSAPPPHHRRADTDEPSTTQMEGANTQRNDKKRGHQPSTHGSLQ